MNTPSPIMNIPVLTEVISSPVVARPAEEGAAPPAQATEAPKPVALAEILESKREWDELEHRLTQRILQLVHERIGFILAHAIKDSLAAVLQKATEELAAEIRSDLHNTLEVVVTHAVAQEIARLQQQDKGNMSDNVERSL